MIDYGAIVIKDGKCVQKDHFDHMIDSVGYVDPQMDGNYFSFIGDKEVTFAFYKNIVKIKSIDEYNNKIIFVGNTNYVGWKYYEDFVSTNDDAYWFRIKNLGNNSYVFKIKYKGHKYKVFFGYGIDVYFYKRTHRPNYYSSIEFKISSFVYDLKDKFDQIIHKY